MEILQMKMKPSDMLKPPLLGKTICVQDTMDDRIFYYVIWDAIYMPYEQKFLYSCENFDGQMKTEKEIRKYYTVLED